jgi:hypothetical protein
MSSEAGDKLNTEEAESSERQQPQEPTAEGGQARRRSLEFKQDLLKRLPTLAAPQWQASETLNVYQELQGIVDLDTDAFLEPLAKITEYHHE